MAFASKTENNTRPDPRIPHLHNLHLNNPLIPNIIQRADSPSLHINIKPKTEKEKTKGRRSRENSNNKRKKKRRLARYPRANTPIMLRWRTHDGASNHNTSPADVVRAPTPDSTHAHSLAKKWTAWPWHSEAPSVIQRPPRDWTSSHTISPKRWHQHHRHLPPRTVTHGRARGTAWMGTVF